MTIMGYGRVSTDGQTLDAQQAALKAAGAERAFSEKVSGAATDRKALGKAIAALGQRDVLVVSRLDRLARSTRDLCCLDQFSLDFRLIVYACVYGSPKGLRHHVRFLGTMSRTGAAHIVLLRPIRIAQRYCKRAPYTPNRGSFA